MPHIPGHTAETPSTFAPWNPASWEEALGASIQDYYTPEQQFAQFATGIRPQWQYRRPLADLQDRLQARYGLQAPMAGGKSNFADYLGSIRPGGGGYGFGTTAQEAVPSGYTQTPADLRTRAQQAATISNLTSQQLAEEYAPGSAGFNQAAWYRQMYGQPSGESLANQRALVNLLALQRPGGGEFRGSMGSAIQNMLSELYQARVAGGDPGSNFLQWYLDKTAPEDQGS